ncbi:fibronectin type III-like domain-contianing protein [Kitasatospora sp. NPDC085879]|uniref:fibronectin type III-like domain-contianing protein n=1 Tax=Kitasatospora sp. NPDC085879 TaxID=3154769 RepID=UPI003424D441
MPHRRTIHARRPLPRRPAARPPADPFGHGLSCTEFRYGSLTAAVDGEHAVAELTVANTGPRAGAEVVQLYARCHDAPVTTPLRRLVGFERVGLAAGEERRVAFRVPLTALGRFDPGHGR